MKIAGKGNSDEDEDAFKVPQSNVPNSAIEIEVKAMAGERGIVPGSIITIRRSSTTAMRSLGMAKPIFLILKGPIKRHNRVTYMRLRLRILRSMSPISYLFGRQKFSPNPTV